MTAGRTVWGALVSRRELAEIALAGRLLAKRTAFARFHAAQSRFYAGEDVDLHDLLTEDVEWHVPGENAIAGHYRGRDAVMAYFARRRELASASMRMYPGEVLAGRDRVAVLTDGSAEIGGREHRWSTIGLYRFRDGRVCEGRLVPLDQRAFDAIWA
jgi:ketosteroid isomerase-like protein